MKKIVLKAACAMCAVLMAFSIAGCASDEEESLTPPGGGQQTEQPDDTTPQTPSDPGLVPDDEEQVTTPPDDDDKPGNTGGTTDPEPDEGGTTNPDEGETTGPEPDEGGTTEPEPDLDAPKTVAELFKNGNEEYQAIVSDTLNDYLYENMVSKAVGVNYNLSNIDDAKWEIVDDGQGNIETIRMFFFNNSSDTSATYYIASVTPKVDITINDLLDPDKTVLDQAFDTNNYFGALYSRDYSFSFDPSIQNERSELRDAINAKLANDGLIPVNYDEYFSVIKPDSSPHPAPEVDGMGRYFNLLLITDKSYYEYNITIKETYPYSGLEWKEDILSHLNNGDYYIWLSEYSYETNTYSGNFIASQDLPENTADKAIKQ